MQVPIVQAPMAGGGSRPELAAAVSEAGGFGFLAAGYKTAQQMHVEIAEARRLTSQPFGLNVFVPRPSVADADAVAAYLSGLEPEATRLHVDIGEAVWDDDDWAAKLDVLRTDPVPVVSFTFGCPTGDEIGALHRVGSMVVVTVTTPTEAALAAEAGADGLALQGIEAGGHRGSFGDPEGT
ncbi:MAG TPA: nitronate monooxygenase, partial [Acidimicrobiales bacterium]|nr:nitronate monooxygenase [Acidimicrobiales bacterium]